MSNYTVTGIAPCIASKVGESAAVTIQNTGSKPCYINETPGIVTQGFLLPPGATKEWPERTPIYIQCVSVTDTTTVAVGENAGAYYAPSVLNSPAILFQNEDAACASTLPPVGGRGDQYTDGTSEYIDCRNYNSVILRAREGGLGGAAHELRDITVNWYVRDRTGLLRLTYTHFFKIYAINDSGGGSQLKAHLPCRGEFFSVTVGPTTFTIAPAVVNVLDVIILGDSRVLQNSVIRNSSFYWVLQELAAGSGVEADQSYDSYFGVTRTFPFGITTNTSMSSSSGLCKVSARINTAAAKVAATRVAISTRSTGTLIWSGFWTTGVTGLQEVHDEIILPPQPCIFAFTNSQAVDTQVIASIVPLEQ